MQILLVTEPGVDGVFRHVEALASFLMERDHRVHLAYSDVRGSDRLTQLVAKVAAAGGRTVNLAVSNAPGPGDVRALLKLRRLVREARPDVIHAHSSKAGALARALVWLGVWQPVFYTPHAYYGLSGKGGMKSRVFNAVEAVLGRIGTTINLSEGERAFARNTLKIPQVRLRLIANPVDCARFRPADVAKRKEIRASLGVPEDAILLGSVGRLAFQKDPLTLYHAFAKACQQRPELWLYHLGEGELSAECAALADELGIRERIVRQTYLSEPLSFYQALDGMILTSRYEGLSFAVLEALACDLPVILSRVPGNNDFMEMGLSHCWSAGKEDVDGFAKVIGQWAQDCGQGRASNHRQIAESRFSQEACFGAIVREYEQKVSAS
ncbi:glycosyltransferase [Prosthecobacter sp.]|uniref:glycosyltransferase n=1 Tax=Prosthecobacter sp. TaxID=1965333 RepID=UPI0037839E97